MAEYKLTKSGLEDLEKELRELIDYVRPEVIEQLTASRAQGDLSENADYDAARNRQAEVEGRIKQIEDILANAVVIDTNTKDNRVGIGDSVVLENQDGKRVTYRIVGTIEADPLNNKISDVSPLGSKLIGHKKGDSVTIVIRDKSTKYKILEVD